MSEISPPPDAALYRAAIGGPTTAVRRSRVLAFASCAVLAVVAVLWETWWVPTGRGTLAIKALPLLIALPGLWRMRLYTYRWLSLAVWLYVTEGLVRGTSSAGHTVLALSWLEVALSTLLFVACAWHVRARLAAGNVLAAQGG